MAALGAVVAWRFLPAREHAAEPGADATERVGVAQSADARMTNK